MSPDLQIDGLSRASFPGAADSFDRIRTIAELRLVDVAPAAPGDEVAAIGFALAFARSAASDGLLIWTAPERLFAEYGAPYAEGLAQFGLDLKRFLIVKTRTQIDALWAAEQGLTLPRAFVLSTIAPSKRPLDLTATRRLLLAAKKNRSACALIRFDAAHGGAAQLRFEVRAAPGESSVYGLGPPAFDVHLTRNRAGPAGGRWRLEWRPYEHAFKTVARPLDGGLSALPADRPPAPATARAG